MVARSRRRTSPSPPTCGRSCRRSRPAARSCCARARPRRSRPRSSVRWPWRRASRRRAERRARASAPSAPSCSATHPDVDLVTFTGSSAVGSASRAQAGAASKRLILELGRQERAALPGRRARGRARRPGRWAPFSVFFAHAGQGCSLQTRMLVPEEHKAAVLDAVAATAAGCTIGDTRDAGTDARAGGVTASLATASKSSWRAGVDAGGRIVAGGARPRAARPRAGTTSPPSSTSTTTRTRWRRPRCSGRCSRSRATETSTKRSRSPTTRPTTCRPASTPTTSPSASTSPPDPDGHRAGQRRGGRERVHPDGRIQAQRRSVASAGSSASARSSRRSTSWSARSKRRHANHDRVHAWLQGARHHAARRRARAEVRGDGRRGRLRVERRDLPGADHHGPQDRTAAQVRADLRPPR